MIRVIYGSKGMGKTRRLVSMANEAAESRHGNVVFIDKDNDHMYELLREVRFINALDYNIDGPKMFTGFLSGIAAQDFDLEFIFINSFKKVVRHKLDELEGLFTFLDAFSDRQKLNIVISISDEAAPPGFIEKYI